MKLCTKCNEEKSLDCFSKKGKGLRSHCKDCSKAFSKAYYAKHMEKMKAASKVYYEENKEEVLKAAKDYYQNNKESRYEWQKEYYKTDRYKKLRKIQCSKYYNENKETISEYHKKWYQDNKETIKVTRDKYLATPKAKAICRQQEQTRRARKESLPATLTVEEWKDICTSWDNKCAYCSSDNTLAQEHIIPVIKGGGYTKENILPACRSCNSSKGVKDMDIWLLGEIQ